MNPVCGNTLSCVGGIGDSQRDSQSALGRRLEHDVGLKAAGCSAQRGARENVLALLDVLVAGAPVRAHRVRGQRTSLT
jgi:hypothetical protein